MDDGFSIFLKAVGTPVGAALTVAVLETACSLARGRSRGNEKYRAWEKAPGTNEEPRPLTRQTLHAVRMNRKLIEVEHMGSFSICEHSHLGIELMIAALAIDIFNPTKADGRVLPLEFILMAHMFALACIVLTNILSEQTINERTKQRSAILSILIGVIGMATAFMGLVLVKDGTT